MIRVLEVVEGGYGLVDECSYAAVGETGRGVGVEGCEVAIQRPGDIKGVWRVAEGCVQWVSA